MLTVLRMAAPVAALMLAAATLAGCLVEPAPYYGGGEGYYAELAPVYVTPRYYTGHWGYWHRPGWRGGGWRGGGHHWH